MVSDGGRDDEEDGGDASKNSQSLGEILRTLHLRDEGGEENLRHPEEGDVENSVHASHPGGTLQGDDESLDLAQRRVVSTIAKQGVILNAGEDEEEEDGDTHGGGGEHGHEGNVLQCSRDGHDNTHDGGDGREGDGAEGVIGQGVEDLGGGEDVETDEEDIVGEQHEPGELVRDLALSEGIVTKVAYELTRD